jgi:hypothetical protein
MIGAGWSDGNERASLKDKRVVMGQAGGDRRSCSNTAVRAAPRRFVQHQSRTNVYVDFAKPSAAKWRSLAFGLADPPGIPCIHPTALVAQLTRTALTKINSGAERHSTLKELVGNGAGNKNSSSLSATDALSVLNSLSDSDGSSRSGGTRSEQADGSERRARAGGAAGGSHVPAQAEIRLEMVCDSRAVRVGCSV